MEEQNGAIMIGNTDVQIELGLPRWRERPQIVMCFLEWFGEVEMSPDWFGSVFIVDLNIPKVFAEMVTQSAARFADVYFLHKVQVIQ